MKYHSNVFTGQRIHQISPDSLKNSRTVITLAGHGDTCYVFLNSLEHPTSLIQIKEWRDNTLDKLVSDWSISMKPGDPFTFYNSYDGRMGK